jgi:hypothetical protein
MLRLAARRGRGAEGIARASGCLSAAATFTRRAGASNLVEPHSIGRQKTRAGLRVQAATAWPAGATLVWDPGEARRRVCPARPPCRRDEGSACGSPATGSSATSSVTPDHRHCGDGSQRCHQKQAFVTLPASHPLGIQTQAPSSLRDCMYGSSTPPAASLNTAGSMQPTGLHCRPAQQLQHRCARPAAAATGCAHTRREEQRGMCFVPVWTAHTAPPLPAAALASLLVEARPGWPLTGCQTPWTCRRRRALSSWPGCCRRCRC